MVSALESGQERAHLAILLSQRFVFRQYRAESSACLGCHRMAHASELMANAPVRRSPLSEKHARRAAPPRQRPKATRPAVSALSD
jgi:hypothetical protein